MKLSLPKVSIPTQSLVVADMKYDNMDGQIAACVLQGIVNREDTEKIYVLNTHCADNRGNWPVPPDSGERQAQAAAQWLTEIFDDIPQTTMEPEDDDKYPAFLGLLKRYAAKVKGMIIFDPDLVDATVEAATTIAGQTDGIVVSPELSNRLKSFGFPIIEDLRLYCFSSNIECLQWLKEKYFQNANKDVAFTWSHMNLGKESWGAANKDYVVANRLFTYYLDIHQEEERDYYENIVKEYPMGTPILGWTDELVADELFAKMGYVMIPYISVENLTVQSSFPSVDLSPPKLPEVEPDEDAVYILFHVADGDNLLHSLVYEPFTIRKDKNFGSVPATWILNPVMAEIAPRAMLWLTNILLANGQEPAAMLGDGSPSSERYEGFHFYCEFVKYHMKKAGMRTMKQMSEGEAVAWNVQPRALLGGYAGTDCRGIGPYEYHLDKNTFHIGSTPLGKADLVSLIHHAPQGRPLFLSVFSGTASSPVSTIIKEASEDLKRRLPNKKIIFVTVSQAAKLYQKWIQHREDKGDQYPYL